MRNNIVKVSRSISFNPIILKQFDKKIGKMPRSVIIEELIINYLKGGKK